MKFVPDARLDNQRDKYKREYDTIFNALRQVEKGSDAYRALLKKRDAAGNRTLLFLNAHRHYFSKKRNWIFQKMEHGGAYGNAPTFEKYEITDRDTTHKELLICRQCGEEFENFAKLNATRKIFCMYCASRRSLHVASGVDQKEAK